MKKSWLIILAACCVIIGAFYAGRLSLEASDESFSGKDEEIDVNDQRSVSREPRDRAGSPRSAILRKSVIVKSSSSTSTEGDWVTIPLEKFVGLSREKYGYDLRINPSGGGFDSEILGLLGVNDHERDVMSSSLKQLGKRVFELRNEHAHYATGKTPNEMIVSFESYDDQLTGEKQALRAAIQSALGRGRADLFIKVSKLEEFLSDSSVMYSGGRVRLHREMKLIKNGESGESSKEIIFWSHHQSWDKSTQSWNETDGVGTHDNVVGDDEELFRNAKLYPWPEHGITE